MLSSQMYIVSNVVFCTEFSPGSKYSELQIIRSSRGVRIRNKDSLASFQVVVSHDIVLVMARVSLCIREGLLSKQSQVHKIVYVTGAMI